MLDVFKTHFAEAGFTEQSPIQQAVWEPMQHGDSVLGLAPTGSGKTLAFIWPILADIIPGDGPQALILAPSQELAMQTTKVVREWAALVDAKVTAVTGGANVKRQLEKLKKHPEIVVGTPGRVQNLVDDGKLKLHLVRTIIIDEADELLTDETLAQVQTIIKVAPGDVQLGFFSATETPLLKSLTEQFGRTIIRVDVRQIDQTQGVVRHRTMQVSGSRKIQRLKQISRIDDFRGLVFFNQVGDLTKAASDLRHQHVPFASLTSNQRQVEREKALREFRNGKVTLLLTTDVAARGLDIPKLPAVINFDLPKDSITYVHRSGRTGRMGAEGLVLTFGNDHDLRTFKQRLRDTDYVIQPAYFDDYKIVDEAPVRQTVAAKTIPVLHSHEAEAGEAKKVHHQRVHHTEVKAADEQQPVTSGKKHKHNKHSKKKGMRKKNRDRFGTN